MSIVTTQQMIEIDNVTNVIVSPISEDSAGYIRAIRVYGTPGGDNAPLYFELRIKSDTLSSLNVTTPVFEF